MVEFMPFGGAGGRAFVWSQRGNLMLTVQIRARVNLVSEGTATVTTAGPIPAEEEWTPVLMKPEVVVRATAYPPAATTAMSVRLFVGRDSGPVLDKTLHIYGERTPRGAPTSFRSMPITYERALGGPGTDNPVGRNPVQAGAAPNIVDPVNNWMIAGFGAIDERWPSRQRLRGPVAPRHENGLLALPDSLDLAFFQTAPSDQRVSHLEGDEWLVLDGLHTSLARFRTQLPGLAASARITNPRKAAGPVEVTLDRLVIDMNGLFAELDYRGTVALEALHHGLSVVAGVASLDDLEPEPTVTKPRPIELPKPDLGSTWTNVRQAPQAAPPALPFRARLDDLAEDPETTVTSLVELQALAGGVLPFPMPQTEPRPNAAAQSSALPFRPLRAPAKGLEISVPRISEEPEEEFTASIHLGSFVRAALPFGSKQAPAVERTGHRAEAPMDLSKTAPPFVPEPAVLVERVVQKSNAATEMISEDTSVTTDTDPLHTMPERAPRLLFPPAQAPIAVDSPKAIDLAQFEPPQEQVEPAVEAAVEKDPGRRRIRDAIRDGVALRTLDLAGVDLSGLDLSNQDLRDLPLSSAKLARTILVNARLSGVKLQGADMVGADLRGADLTGADISRANLSEANLTGAVLNQVNATGARLERTVLTDAKADQGIFVTANFGDAKAERISVRDGDLSGAQLTRANFASATLVNARLAEARADEAKFPNADLVDASCGGASFVDADFRDAQVTRAQFDRTDLTRANFDRVKGGQTKFARARLGLASFVGAELEKSDFSGTTGEGAEFSESNVSGSDFRTAKLPDLRMQKAKFVAVQAQKLVAPGARFEGADLTSASLRGARLKEADLAGAILAGADFRDADLENGRVDAVDLGKAKTNGANMRGLKSGPES